ncbi:hypothetical protein OIN60_17500 [Paenibacillus sp. P96]|uniref:LexA repressor DNA-binding domain-containing protein n=1 Tax=Paenibacillus zeirhizosphaerae TaxID=2987519 RepID=A0ABT9FUZ9_9BACL|nr:hypothetical protein [Paenibacillus sp. P96]MDP4098530.1 hypothetical protein [Paenibacillus sp. P96]
MLPDFERKLLRILYNFFAQHRRMPTAAELSVRTGRQPRDLSAGLLHLEKEGYIRWEDRSSTQHVVILEGWERAEPRQSAFVRMEDGGRSAVVEDGTKYWTEY